VRIAVVAVAVAVVLAGCRPVPAASTPGSSAPPDTLRGTFALEGAEPMIRAVLRVPDGSVTLVDAPRDLLPLSGTDVKVIGHHLDGGRFRVDAFLVRAVGGLPAWDGVLTRLQPADRYALILADRSSHALRAVPEAFRAMVGQRIWVAESPGGAVATYGVITRAAAPR
jgi:hypothetical protein